MKLHVAAFLLFLSAAGSAASAASSLRGGNGLFEEAAPSEERGQELVDIIVQLNDDSVGGPPGLATAAEKRSKASAVAQGLGLTAEHAYGATIYGFSARNVPGARLEQIAVDPAVKSVDLDGIVQLPVEVESDDGDDGRRLQKGSEKSDPSGGARRKLPKGGPGGGSSTVPQTVPWGIARVNAVENPTPSGRVCVLDTGIDLTNADLNIASDCFNAFTKGRNAQSCNDDNGHGTHVAGTIAAKDNDIDVVGVAPGVTVVAVKVLGGNGRGTWSGIIAGIEWAAQNNCDVANLSLGGSSYSLVDDAVIALGASGAKVVLSAGNDGEDATNASPARANGSNVYTVSASTYLDRLWTSSNYGNPPIDVAAPGASVYSLKRGGGTIKYTGTSMAAPHVAGLLMYNATICTDGFAAFDPDGSPDPIAVMCS